MTKKSSVEKLVASSEKKYRSMVDTVVDAVWVIDAATLNYLYVSPDIYRLRGYTQEEILGLPIEKSMTAESFEHIRTLFKKAKSAFDAGETRSQSTEIELFHKNGSTVWLEITAKFVLDDDQTLKVVGISRNINKRKTAEIKKAALVEELNEALAEKEKLLREIKRLESLLPICSGCRRIRDENDVWWPLEKYIEKHSDSEFSHTICPDCTGIYYPDLKKKG